MAWVAVDQLLHIYRRRPSAADSRVLVMLAPLSSLFARLLRLLDHHNI